MGTEGDVGDEVTKNNDIMISKGKAEEIKLNSEKQHCCLTSCGSLQQSQQSNQIFETFCMVFNIIKGKYYIEKFRGHQIYVPDSVEDF